MKLGFGVVWATKIFTENRQINKNVIIEKKEAVNLLQLQLFIVQ